MFISSCVHCTKPNSHSPKAKCSVAIIVPIPAKTWRGSHTVRAWKPPQSHPTSPKKTISHGFNVCIALIRFHLHKGTYSSNEWTLLEQHLNYASGRRLLHCDLSPSLPVLSPTGFSCSWCMVPSLCASDTVLPVWAIPWLCISLENPCCSLAVQRSRA